ncbi:hypothetical protein [Microcoleus sp. AT3-D2]|uniref:hypothetical protein n=1 Tax=Microcoleus sp. AT3-D2 TaxID=2818612 RepID=UPI002FD383AF
MRSTNLLIQRAGDRILGWKGRAHFISFSQRAGDRFLVWKGQRDREQIELYKQKEQEQKERDREQMEIGRKKEDKEKSALANLRISSFCRNCDRRWTNLLGQLSPNQRYTD